MSTSISTLTEQLLDRAEKTPQARAMLQKFRGKWNETTWSDYAQAVAEVARGLDAIGIGEGHNVLIVVDNRPAFAYLDLAAQTIGAISVPVAPATLYSDVSELIARVKPTAIVVQDVGWVEAALRDVGPSCKIIHVDTAGIGAYQDERLAAYQDIRDLGAKSADAVSFLRSRAKGLRPDSIATMSVSSGTGGVLNLYSFTTQQVVESAQVVAKRFPLDKGQFVLSHAPLAAAAERTLTLYSAIFTGAVVAFPENSTVASAAAIEIEPHLARIPSAALDEIAFTSLRRLRRNKGLKKFVVRGLLGAMKSNSASSNFAHLFGAKFILQQFGLRRCKTVLVSNAAASGLTTRFLKSLRLPAIDVYTVSCSLVPIMVSQTLGAPYDEVLEGVEVGISPEGRVQLRGSLVSASGLCASGWHETNDNGISENGVVTILGAKAFGNSVGKTRALEAAVSSSNYVGRAAIVALSDGTNGIFLQLESEALSSWALQQGIPFTTLAAVVDDRRVHELLVGEVSAIAEQLSLLGSIHTVIIGRRPLTVDAGELTVTGKVRSHVVESRSNDVRLRISEFSGLPSRH
jgi:long-chain acyl-CoA synthetase